MYSRCHYVYKLYKYFRLYCRHLDFLLRLVLSSHVDLLSSAVLLDPKGLGEADAISAIASIGAKVQLPDVA